MMPLKYQLHCSSSHIASQQVMLFLDRLFWSHLSVHRLGPANGRTWCGSMLADLANHVHEYYQVHP